MTSAIAMTSAPSSPRSAASSVVGSPLDLLELVDGLAPGMTGEVVLRDGAAEVVGMVFVDAGRVCWVAARGGAGRLSCLLRARTRPTLDEASMEEVFRRCKREGKRLGEHLVSERLLDPTDLRAALLEHSAECLATLGERRVSARFAPRSGAGYASDFTFSTTELAATWGALATGRQGARPREALAALEPTWGAAFAELTRGGAGHDPDPRRELPVPIAQVGPPGTVRALLEVGRWASGVARAAGTLAAERMLSFADDAKGGVVVWREAELVHVTCFAQQSTFSRAMSRRATRGG